PQSSSTSRFTAGASGFFILSQSGERPERYIDSLRFDTMPSRPSLQAWAKTVGPSPSKCSLKRSSIWAIENRINAELYRVKENDYIHTDYMTANSGAVLSKKYADFMTSVTTLTWSIQPQNGFVINDSLTGLSYSGNDPILTIAFTARSKPFEPFETVREDIVTEIELIKSFAKDDVSHGITRGDSLWKLAKQYYGSGFYYNFLAAANNIKNSSVSRLRDGQIIVIPAMHKLSPLDGYHFLAPGETLIGLCQNWMPGQFGRCLAAIRKKNPGLSLHKIYALQGIRKPDKEEANNKP